MMQHDLQIIIPSAGGSTRLGGDPKQEVTVRDKKLWQNTLDICEPLSTTITLVTGRWRPQLTLPNHVTEVHFEQWQLGLGASIAFGVTHAVTPKLGYLILLIDQWGLTAQNLKRFVAQWDTSSTQIATEAEYSGPPVLFPVSMRPKLTSLTGEKGAKKLIQSTHPTRISVLGASWDLDTPEDLFLMQQLTQTENNKD
jgi:CTP:molybdopterin cytidylyltransferase MocA